MISQISSYADETGHEADPDKKHIGLAGILAQSDAWEKFDSEWRKICSEEEVDLPFHMAEFASFRKQFSKPEWKDESKRRRLLGRFLDAIEQANAIPVGVMVSLDDFNSLSESQRIRAGGPQASPYYRAFQSLTYEMVMAAALTIPPSPVSMVYAKRKKYTGRAEELWYAIKEHNRHLSFWMSSYTSGEPKDFTPLQAADFWAYELGHHFQTIIPEGRKWRYPFTRFYQLGMKAVFGHKFFTYFDRRKLLESLGEPENETDSGV
jgi:hypothetical protein